MELSGRGTSLPASRIVDLGEARPVDVTRWIEGVLSEEIAEELGLEKAVIDDGDPDPWAVSAALGVVMFGVAVGFYWMDAVLLAAVAFFLATVKVALAVLIAE